MQASAYYRLSMKVKSKSKKINKAWLLDHLNDTYVKLAKKGFEPALRTS